MASRTGGAIGSVDLAYANKQVAYALLLNKDGQFVTPGARKKTKKRTKIPSRASCRLGQAQDFYLLLTNHPGEDVGRLPGRASLDAHIIPTPYIAQRGVEFFDWPIPTGKTAESLITCRCRQLVQAVEQSWQQIKGSDLKPVVDRAAS